MTTPNDVLNVARRWIGTGEQPPGSNRVPGVTDWYGIGNGPWCAMWVSRVFFDAGLPLPATIGRGFAYCPSGVNWFKKRNRWTQTPQPGYVIFLKWPGSDRADHVGIVESVNRDGSVNTIEGNTNRAGGSEGLYCMRQVRRSYILGYGIPDYDGASAAPVEAPIVVPSSLDLSDRYSVEAFVAALPIVRQGSTGQHVKIAQGLIVANGANIAVDGDFGPGTHAALVRWQAAVNLEADGVVGPQTWRRLLCI